MQYRNHSSFNLLPGLSNSPMHFNEREQKQTNPNTPVKFIEKEDRHRKQIKDLIRENH